MYFNIPVIQSLRILEGAASLALLFRPEEVKTYLKQIGLSEQMIEKEMQQESIINTHSLRQIQEKLNAQRRDITESKG